MNFHESHIESINQITSNPMKHGDFYGDFPVRKLLVYWVTGGYDTMNHDIPGLQQSDLPRQRGRLRLRLRRLAAGHVRVGRGALRAAAHLLQGAWR